MAFYSILNLAIVSSFAFYDFGSFIDIQVAHGEITFFIREMFLCFFLVKYRRLKEFSVVLPMIVFTSDCVSQMGNLNDPISF